MQRLLAILVVVSGMGCCHSCKNNKCNLCENIGGPCGMYSLAGRLPPVSDVIEGTTNGTAPAAEPEAKRELK